MADKPKKILLVSPNMSVGGVAVCIMKQYRILKDNGFDVSIWCLFKGRFSDNFDEMGIDVRYIDIYSISNQLDSMLDELRTFDFVLANSVVSAAISDIAQCVVPTVLYLHEAAQIPVHAEFDCRYLYALKRAERVYSVSNYTRDYLYTQYLIESEVIPNCGDGWCVQASNMPDRGGKVKLLCLGSIDERKGIDTVVSAFKDLTDYYRSRCELHFAGPIGNESNIGSMLIDLVNLHNNVFYHGIITDRKELHSLIDQMDTVVVDSRDDPCPLVVYEAAESGKPVITSKNVGSNFLAENGAGWIIEPGNSNSLREVFESVIDNPELLMEMSKQILRNYLSVATFEIYEKNILRLVNDNLVASIETYRKDHSQKLALLRSYIAKEENNALRQLIKRSATSNQKKDRLFPFHKLPYGSDVVLYGAGLIGQSFYRQLRDSKYCNIVLWVDQNAENLIVETGDIRLPKDILKTDFDYVVITALSTHVSTEILLNLLNMGISREKIILPIY